MFCPDDDKHHVSEEAAMRQLICSHGQDISKWPTAVPDAVKTAARPYILAHKRLNPQSTESSRAQEIALDSGHKGLGPVSSFARAFGGGGTGIPKSLSTD